MAAVVVLCVFLTVAPFLHKTVATTVEVTVPVYPVTVGGVLAIQCEIQDIEKNHKMKMFRVINGQIEELTTDLRYISDVLGQRYFVTKRTTPGRKMVYFMTIVDMSTLDAGEYLCRVYAASGRDFIQVAEGSIDVEIYFLPNNIYPQCQSAPAVTNDMDENVQLRATCISAEGAPAVELRWIDNLNQEVSYQDKNVDDTVTSEINLRTSMLLDGTIFTCEMRSPGFPDIVRTCQVGPITIKKSSRTGNTGIMKPKVPTQVTKHKTLISTDCDNECSESNEYTIAYLSMATVGASVLCVVFLITTIIMCYKYNNKSNEIRNAQGAKIACSDGSEPVYVSLQRRLEPERSLYGEPERRSVYREPDRSSTYMSVEDPNNPGNKVLMPKEVFEEFYNSLTLKKI